MAEIVLTPGQRAAVESRGCALLVAAAAGSGKTRVLIDRVLDQVIREGRCVDEFLLITFTQAAAAELRGKLLAELNRRLAADPENRHLQRQLSRVYLAQISTVHSFCAALLRDYAHVLELPADFRLADEQEAAALRERAVRAVLEEAYADPSPAVRAALDLPGAGRDDRALQELIVRVGGLAGVVNDKESTLTGCVNRGAVTGNGAATPCAIRWISRSLWIRTPTSASSAASAATLPSAAAASILCSASILQRSSPCTSSSWSRAKKMLISSCSRAARIWSRSK